MPLRAVVFDFDGTLVQPNSQNPQPGVLDLLAGLRARGLRVGIMSGRSDGLTAGRALAAGITHDGIVDRPTVGATKGSGALVAAFSARHGIPIHAMAVVHDDAWGFREAINGRAFSFHSNWSGTTLPYGIHLDAPAELLEYLDVFFLKSRLWFARYDGVDRMGRTVRLRTLIDGNGAGSVPVKNAIIAALKERRDSTIGNASFSRVLMTHLIASMYLDGFLSIDRNQILWQIYPGHSVQSEPPPLIAAALQGLKVFRGRTNRRGLVGLTRWTDARQSSRSRIRGDSHLVTFLNQANSVLLEPRTNAANKRVIVIDDFSTDGYSLEAGRNFFMAAGAQSVDTFAFGKYGPHSDIVTPARVGLIRPFEARTYQATDFVENFVKVDVDEAALGEFLASLERLAGARIAGKLLV